MNVSRDFLKQTLRNQACDNCEYYRKTDKEICLYEADQEFTSILRISQVPKLPKERTCEHWRRFMT